MGITVVFGWFDEKQKLGLVITGSKLTVRVLPSARHRYIPIPAFL